MDLSRDVVYLGEEPVPKDTLALILVSLLATAILVFRAVVIAPRTRKLAKQSQILSIKPASEPTYYYKNKRSIQFKSSIRSQTDQSSEYSVRSQIEQPSKHLTRKTSNKKSKPVGPQIERPSDSKLRHKREWRSGYYTPFTPSRTATYRYDLTSFYTPTRAPSHRYEPDYDYQSYKQYRQDSKFNHRTNSPYISSSSSRPTSKKHYIYDDDNDESTDYEQDPYRLSEFKEILHDIRNLLSDNRPQASDRVYTVQPSPLTFGGLKWYEWLFPLLAVAATAAFLVETYVKLPELTIAKNSKLAILDVAKDAVTIVKNELESWKGK